MTKTSRVGLEYLFGARLFQWIIRPCFSPVCSLSNSRALTVTRREIRDSFCASGRCCRCSAGFVASVNLCCASTTFCCRLLGASAGFCAPCDAGAPVTRSKKCATIRSPGGIGVAPSVCYWVWEFTCLQSSGDSATATLS